jgi:hypothetical protein
LIAGLQSSWQNEKRFNASHESAAIFERHTHVRANEAAVIHKMALALLSIAAVLGLTSCVKSPSSYREAKTTQEAPVLIGAGDIADCRDLSGAEATAKLLDQNPGTVMAVGDLAYPDGSKENFECYDRTWGRAKTRTRPAVGNHEFHSGGATPYFDYFGSAAAPPATATTATTSVNGTS